MKDRLQEFKNSDVPLQQVVTHSEQSREDILKKVEAISQDIAQLSRLISRAQQMEQQQQDRKDIEHLNKQANDLALRIRADLKSIATVIDSSLVKGSANHRMASMQYAQQARKMRDLIIGYQKSQEAYQQKQKERFTREYKIINPYATQAEIDSAQGGGDIFAQHILASTQNEEARVVLKDVQSRQEDLTQLSEQIEQLAVLFEDLNDLVIAQNDSIASISENMDQAVTYTGNVNQEMAGAINTAKKVRRRKWCCTFLCLVLIAVAVLVVIFVAVPAIKQATATAT